ncbi:MULTISPECIES: hypothetical protein [Bacillaceae]|uniref:Uncharacterized membrane protein YjjP (DUF1212 family) n=1 Tax=Peribacillus huizhouensis TaxID=1501239 RepID=A0ABR6CJ33_9BACI|nr:MULTISPECIES: hypothetical protein [Bacillaceae]MBA9025030.1 uncharacterized membrane protein YjjP (DUF1212 family) [Peribacillus huizhouensis]
MKNYVVFLFQLIVWSGYTVVEWLSMHDKFLFKVLMFFIFSYLAIYIGKVILKSNKQTWIVTGVSLACYAIIQVLLQTILPIT